MSDLTQYHKRRDFSRTTEPSSSARAPHAKPGTPAQGLGYVIQKHAARQLHYDLRLELDGVLLSWAVPKGPCLDPSVKRLAVQVEPHPVAYSDFEGQIAEGQYGAGTVMVWDTGTWQPEDEDPAAAHAKGHLTFTLSGKKLKGGWHLVRTRRNSDTQWLLFKRPDAYAEPGENTILEREPDSAVSARSLDQIANKQAAKSKAPKAKQGSAKAAPKITRSKGPRAVRKAASAALPRAQDLEDATRQLPGAIPNRIPPQVELQLATLAESAPAGDAWLHEIKFDGYRVLTRIVDGTVSLFTRGGLDWTNRMPALFKAWDQLKLPDAVIDGELVALDAAGVSHFQTLQNSLSSRAEASLAYYAFDLLHYDGFDLRGVPLIERKALLNRVLEQHLSAEHQDPTSGLLRFSDHVLGNGGAFFDQACGLKLEGIVSKRADGLHVDGRSRDWLKVKCSHRQEFVILGYTKPAGSRTHFGALLVGIYEGADLTYAGRVGTGFTQRSLKELHERLLPLHSEAPALRNAPKGAQARGVQWVEPILTAQVAFSGFTAEGILRHPAFEGLREDKLAKEIQRELPRTAVPAKLDTSGVKLTHPDKVLYPEDGLTKRDLLDYAALVATVMLPHVVNRPLTLVRCPGGAAKPCFFQKHPNDSHVPGLRSIAIREKEGKAEYTTIEDAQGLFALMQLSVLEIHTCGSLADDYEHPNILVFDLDPDPSLAFGAVIDCARRLRELFQSANLESFVKTTGGKGLHVCVPIDPTLRWAEAKGFTQRIAQALVEESPKLYVATQSKAERTGKIYIDYLRNARGATFIAPYSTRARPGAPIAAPVFWEELTPTLKPDQFTVSNLARRLSELKEDPFARMAHLKQALPRAPR